MTVSAPSRRPPRGGSAAAVLAELLHDRIHRLFDRTVLALAVDGDRAHHLVEIRVLGLAGSPVARGSSPPRHRHESPLPPTPTCPRGSRRSRAPHGSGRWSCHALLPLPSAGDHEIRSRGCSLRLRSRSTPGWSVPTSTPPGPALFGPGMCPRRSSRPPSCTQGAGRMTRNRRAGRAGRPSGGPRGGLTSKVHLAADRRVPASLAGHQRRAPPRLAGLRAGHGRIRIRRRSRDPAPPPEHVLGNQAYSSRVIRSPQRQHRIRATIGGAGRPAGQPAAPRPQG